MPRGDGTGPARLGPMTGRAAGYCAGSPAPGFTSPGPGGYAGRGRGRGRGWRNWFRAIGLTGRQRAVMGRGGPVAGVMSREQELEALKEQAEGFKDALEGIKTRIEELDSEAK